MYSPLHRGVRGAEKNNSMTRGPKKKAKTPRATRARAVDGTSEAKANTCAAPYPRSRRPHTARRRFPACSRSHTPGLPGILARTSEELGRVTSMHTDPPKLYSVLHAPRKLTGTGRGFAFTTASHLQRAPLGGLLQQLLPQRGVRSRRWDQASGPEQQKQLVVRYKRLSCAASLVAAWRRIDRSTLTRSTRRCFLASASSQPTSRPPPQPSRTWLGLNRSCCSAGAGELLIYNADAQAVSHINDYL